MNKIKEIIDTILVALVIIIYFAFILAIVVGFPYMAWKLLLAVGG